MLPPHECLGLLVCLHRLAVRTNWCGYWGTRVLVLGGRRSFGGEAAAGLWGQWEVVSLGSPVTRTSPFGIFLPKCPLAELQQQKWMSCLCEMLSLPSLSERKRNVFAFIASPSVDPAVYIQILSPLESLHTHLCRGSRFLGVLVMEGGFYMLHPVNSTSCFWKRLKLDYIYFTVIQEALITETESLLVRKCSQVFIASLL